MINLFCLQVPSLQTDHRVYLWFIGVAVLLCGTIFSLGGALAVCYCAEKWTKVQSERERLEKYGEYERIESVSSFVSFGETSNTRVENEALESVSMI